jgi:hypothetical protein
MPLPIKTITEEPRATAAICDNNLDWIPPKDDNGQEISIADLIVARDPRGRGKYRLRLNVIVERKEVGSEAVLSRTSAPGAFEFDIFDLYEQFPQILPALGVICQVTDALKEPAVT